MIEARPIQSRRPRGRRAILLLAVAGLAACALGFALTRSYPAARYEGMEALRDEVTRQLGPVRVVSHRKGARCNTFMQSIGASCSEPRLSVAGEVPSDRADGLCEAFRSAVSAATGGDVGASSWGPGTSCFVYGVHGQLLVSGGLSSPSSMVLSISLFGQPPSSATQPASLGWRIGIAARPFVVSSKSAVPGGCASDLDRAIGTV